MGVWVWVCVMIRVCAGMCVIMTLLPASLRLSLLSLPSERNFLLLIMLSISQYPSLPLSLSLSISLARARSLSHTHTRKHTQADALGKGLKEESVKRYVRYASVNSPLLGY